MGRAFFVIGVSVAAAALAVIVAVVVSDNESGGGDSADVTLVGPVWQWEEYLGNDDSTVTPEDPSKYTIQFSEDGSISVQADCNRAFGTYTEQDGTLTIEPSGTTQAQCEEGSLGDQYLRDLAFVGSYVIEDGNLYLDLMADGGELRHSQS